MIAGITFDKCNVSSRQDAHYHYTFLNGVDGVTKGCAVTADREHLYIGKGFFIIYGRLVEVTGMETVTPDTVISGQLYERLVFEIDLTKENTIESFQQGYFRIITGTERYPDCTKQDLDSDGTLYQMPFAKFIMTTSGISNFVSELHTLNMADFYTTLSKTLSEYDTEAEGMIEDLKNKGFVTQTAFHADNVPEAIEIAPAEWAEGDGTYSCTVICTKAKASNYCHLEIALGNPSSMTGDALKKLQKEFGYFFPEPEVGNGYITFTARVKPTVTIPLRVTGGIAQ